MSNQRSALKIQDSRPDPNCQIERFLANFPQLDEQLVESKQVVSPANKEVSMISQELFGGTPYEPNQPAVQPMPFNIQQLYNLVFLGFGNGCCKTDPETGLIVLTEVKDDDVDPSSTAKTDLPAIKAFAEGNRVEILRYAPKEEDHQPNEDELSRQAFFCQTIHEAFEDESHGWERRLEPFFKTNSDHYFSRKTWIALACVHLWNTNDRFPVETVTRSHDETVVERQNQMKFLRSQLSADEIRWIKTQRDPTPSLERRDEIKVIVVAMGFFHLNTTRQIDALFNEGSIEFFRDN